jgi:hypothetical protein
VRRLCFLFPTIERTRDAVEALRHANVGESNIMIVAKHDIPLGDLPAADVDATDAVPGLERGLAGGAIIGALAGIMVVRFTALGIVLGGAAIPLLTAFGAAVSGLLTFLAGASFPSTRLKSFENAIESGKILLMVDVDNSREKEIEDLLKSQCPEGDFVGYEPHAPIVPR